MRNNVLRNSSFIMKLSPKSSVLQAVWGYYSSVTTDEFNSVSVVVELESGQSACSNAELQKPEIGISQSIRIHKNKDFPHQNLPFNCIKFASVGKMWGKFCVCGEIKSAASYCLTALRFVLRPACCGTNRTQSRGRTGTGCPTGV